MAKRKVILLLSGYIIKHALWDKKGKKIRKFLEEYPANKSHNEYEVFYKFDDYLFIHPTKGFEHFASCLAKEVENQAFDRKIVPKCKCCGQPRKDKAYIRKGADEIILLGHSMGGVLAWLYMKDGNIGDPKAKEKVKHVITIASPHHGTTVELMEYISFFAGACGLSWEVDEIIEDGIARTGKCFRQIRPDSEFIRKLNTPPEVPSNTNFYSIWGKGDLISCPVQTAVLTGAYNYFHDNFRVRHGQILRWTRTIDILRNILDAANSNDPIPPVTGLQRYPARSKGNCINDDGHFWIPLWPRNDIEIGTIEIPHIAPYEKEFVWKCQNQLEGEKCDAQVTQRWFPKSLGCEIGKLDSKWRWHKWQKVERVWKCQKCGERFTGKSRPNAWGGDCVGIFSSKHRWRVEKTKWQCKHCDKTYVKSGLIRPPKLGCTEGWTENKLHEWKKVSEIQKFRFKCLYCDKEEWISGRDETGRQKGERIWWFKDP